jgi:acyl carrier protein
MARGGMSALEPQEGLALLEAAAGRDEALLVPARIDVAAIRARAGRGLEVPPLWRALAGPPPRQRAAAGGGEAAGALQERLAATPAADRSRMVLDLVRSHAAAVLGHASAASVGSELAFSDLGFDSLTAVELRNRLNAATGLRLPATLVFDYPSPALLAAHLHTELAGELSAHAVPIPLIQELDKLESLLTEVTADDSMYEMVTARLQACLSKLGNIAAISKSETVTKKINSASDDEIFEFINKELGRA